jgi:hypothetical protein
VSAGQDAKLKNVQAAKKTKTEVAKMQIWRTD